MSSLTDIDDESVAGVSCLSAITASTAQHERSETLAGARGTHASAGSHNEGPGGAATAQ
jgi:hypothetical protein